MRSWTLPTIQWGASGLAALILIQAALAGQNIFGTASIDVHGYLGNLSFLIGLGLAAIAAAGRAPRIFVGGSLLLVVTLTSQIGLGYSGRETAGAAAWHVPLGVLCVILATVLATASWTAAPGRPR